MTARSLKRSIWARFISAGGFFWVGIGVTWPPLKSVHVAAFFST
jgi:hypothetical protein